MALTSGSDTTRYRGEMRNPLIENDTDASIRTIAFDDLPGEIRNQIYKHAVVTNFPIDITRYNVTPHQPRTVRRTTQWKPKASINISEVKRKRNKAVNQVLNISLLGVSKAVNHEASQILFGENLFVFETVPAVEVFCSAIGVAKTSLRSVELKYNLRTKPDFRYYSSLSCMSKPSRIVAAPAGYSSLVASPRRTRDMIRGIIMQKAVEVRDGNGVCSLKLQETTDEEQVERLNAFVFETSGHCYLAVGQGEQAIYDERIADNQELRRRLIAGVWMWREKEVEKVEERKSVKVKAKAKAKAKAITNGGSNDEDQPLT